MLRGMIFSLSIIHRYIGDPDSRNVIFMAVDAVSLKLPTFWASQPEVRFVQAEAQFRLREIDVDETKYYYVIATLDQETAARLMDLIGQPPEDDKYEILKNRLMDTFGLNKREQAARLLHFRRLGDSKPSALMDEMLALLGAIHPAYYSSSSS